MQTHILFFYQNYFEIKLIIVVVKHLPVVVNFIMTPYTIDKTSYIKPMTFHDKLMFYYKFYFLLKWLQNKIYGKAVLNLFFERFWVIFSEYTFNSLPSIPLSSLPHVENFRATCNGK